MAKPEWGTKRECPKCKTRFYDLGRDPVTCPDCGHSFEIASLANQLGRPVLTSDTGKAVPEPEDAVLVEELEVDVEVEADDTVLEDDALDGDDVPLEAIADVAKEDDES